MTWSVCTVIHQTSLRGFFLWRSGEMNLQRLVDEASQFGFLVGKDGWQRDIALEIADFDDHFIAFFGHLHFSISTCGRGRRRIYVSPCRITSWMGPRWKTCVGSCSPKTCSASSPSALTPIISRER